MHQFEIFIRANRNCSGPTCVHRRLSQPHERIQPDWIVKSDLEWFLFDPQGLNDAE